MSSLLQLCIVCLLQFLFLVDAAYNIDFSVKYKLAPDNIDLEDFCLDRSSKLSYITYDEAKKYSGASSVTYTGERPGTYYSHSDDCLFYNLDSSEYKGRGQIAFYVRNNRKCVVFCDHEIFPIPMFEKDSKFTTFSEFSTVLCKSCTSKFGCTFMSFKGIKEQNGDYAIAKVIVKA